MQNNTNALNSVLDLDFSGLFDDVAPGGAMEQSAGDGSNEVSEPEQAITLSMSAQQKQEQMKRSIEIFREYQANIRASAQLRSEITKGIHAGEDIYSLFLKAAKAISLMTSDTVFYDQAAADIGAIYGRGLEQPAPLARELEDAQNRLDRLLAAEHKEPDMNSRERLRRAANAHRESIEYLKQKISKSEMTQP